MKKIFQWAYYVFLLTGAGVVISTLTNQETVYLISLALWIIACILVVTDIIATFIKYMRSKKHV